MLVNFLQIIADVVHSDDQKLIFETLAPAITDFASFAKYMNTFIKRKTVCLENFIV